MPSFHLVSAQLGVQLVHWTLRSPLVDFFLPGLQTEFVPWLPRREDLPSLSPFVVTVIVFPKLTCCCGQLVFPHHCAHSLVAGFPRMIPSVVWNSSVSVFSYAVITPIAALRRFDLLRSSGGAAFRELWQMTVDALFFTCI